jgi:hypothetical protein
LVPVTNGSIPDAPDGGHITQAGTLVEGAAAALPDNPPELVEEGALTALGDALVVRALDADVVTAEPDAAPAVVVLAAAGDPAGAVVASATLALLVVTVEAVALLPSVTTPPFVTLFCVAVVCARA